MMPRSMSFLPICWSGNLHDAARVHMETVGHDEIRYNYTLYIADRFAEYYIKNYKMICLLNNFLNCNETPFAKKVDQFCNRS